MIGLERGAASERLEFGVFNLLSHIDVFYKLCDDVVIDGMRSEHLSVGQDFLGPHPATCLSINGPSIDNDQTSTTAAHDTPTPHLPLFLAHTLQPDLFNK